MSTLHIISLSSSGNSDKPVLTVPFEISRFSGCSGSDRVVLISTDGRVLSFPCSNPKELKIVPFSREVLFPIKFIVLSEGGRLAAIDAAGSLWVEGEFSMKKILGVSSKEWKPHILTNKVIGLPNVSIVPSSGIPKASCRISSISISETNIAAIDDSGEVWMSSESSEIRKLCNEKFSVIGLSQLHMIGLTKEGQLRRFNLSGQQDLSFSTIVVPGVCHAEEISITVVPETVGDDFIIRSYMKGKPRLFWLKIGLGKSFLKEMEITLKGVNRAEISAHGIFFQNREGQILLCSWQELINRSLKVDQEHVKLIARGNAFTVNKGYVIHVSDILKKVDVGEANREKLFNLMRQINSVRRETLILAEKAREISIESPRKAKRSDLIKFAVQRQSEALEENQLNLENEAKVKEEIDKVKRQKEQLINHKENVGKSINDIDERIHEAKADHALLQEELTVLKNDILNDRLEMQSLKRALQLMHEGHVNTELLTVQKQIADVDSQILQIGKRLSTHI